MMCWFSSNAWSLIAATIIFPALSHADPDIKSLSCISSENCAMPAVIDNQIGDCTLSNGICPKSSCSSNGFSGGNGKNCNKNCPWQSNAYTVDCKPYKSDCNITSKQCFGFTVCNAGECPDIYLGMFCFFVSGNSNVGPQYKVCGCDSPSTGYVSQCPSSKCNYWYPAPIGGPTSCSAGGYCPQYSQCPNGNCGLPGPDTDCACAAACIGKCCPSTGNCQAASCDGNKINNPSGHEYECVLNKDKTNSGGQCPWGDYSYGVMCNYLPGCTLGNKNNCWGYTACALGTCPDSAVGAFCIESGSSDNFKVCGCSGPNVDGVAANCTASVPPQAPAAVTKCKNGNCAPADPYPTCTAACAGGACIGKCCSSTGKCAAASCDGNKINNPSGHEHECVVRKDGSNAGGQCPWSGQTYGVKCTYLPNCAQGNKNNCWGYTTCAKGTCPASAVGVFCIESGNSDNFKICGCTGEGSTLPSGAAVAYKGCTVLNTSAADVTGPWNCPAGYYCPTPCSAVRCPCGFYCPVASTAPIACPAGEYCPENSATPISSPFLCPSGYYCPIPETDPKYYCTIKPCSPDVYCPPGSTDEEDCPEGWICSPEYPEPFPCPAGSYCPPDASSPIGCTAGSYCPPSSSIPTPCPCGYRCPPGTSAPQKCAPPFYCPNTGMTAQVLCPIGFMCPYAGMCEAIACPLGTFVSCSGKKSCDDCPVGRYCPQVTQSLLCPAGSYCPVRTSQPIPCQEGSFCPLGSKVPALCQAGSFCPAGATAYQLCPQGTFCPPGASSPLPCESKAAMGPGLSACPPDERRQLDGASPGGTVGRHVLEAAQPTIYRSEGSLAAGLMAFTLLMLLAIGMVARRVLPDGPAAHQALC